MWFDSFESLSTIVLTFVMLGWFVKRQEYKYQIRAFNKNRKECIYMSDGNTQTAREAAKEMLESDMDNLRREMVNEGAYHVVVEGGFHSRVLDDSEADFLAMTLINHGLTGLRGVAEYDYGRQYSGRKDVAGVIPFADTDSDAFEEIVTRLQDGNDFPGTYVESDEDTKSYTVFQEGYE